MRCYRLRQSSSAASRGFTLVEILAVLVILGIAAAMVVPRVGTLGDLQSIAGARILVSDMEYAQSEAIVTQQPVTVTFDTAASSYTLTSGSTPLTNPLTKGNYTTVFPATRGCEKVRILSADFGGQESVTFDALGAPDNGGQVNVIADGHQYQVSVAPVIGKVSVTAVTP